MRYFILKLKFFKFISGDIKQVIANYFKWANLVLQNLSFCIILKFHFYFDTMVEKMNLNSILDIRLIRKHCMTLHLYTLCVHPYNQYK